LVKTSQKTLEIVYNTTICKKKVSIEYNIVTTLMFWISLLRNHWIHVDLRCLIYIGCECLPFILFPCVSSLSACWILGNIHAWSTFPVLIDSYFPWKKILKKKTLNLVSCFGTGKTMKSYRFGVDGQSLSQPLGSHFTYKITSFFKWCSIWQVSLN